MALFFPASFHFFFFNPSGCESAELSTEPVILVTSSSEKHFQISLDPEIKLANGIL